MLAFCDGSLLSRLGSCRHVATFEGQTIGNGEPGPIFTRLLDAWKRSVRIDFVAQARGYAERLPDWEQQ